MARLSFTGNLHRHLPAPSRRVHGRTVREVMDAYFGECPQLRGYILDDQGAVRRHVAIFRNQELICDRRRLSDRVAEDDEIFVAQALSGG